MIIYLSRGLWSRTYWKCFWQLVRTTKSMQIFDKLYSRSSIYSCWLSSKPQISAKEEKIKLQNNCGTNVNYTDIDALSRVMRGSFGFGFGGFFIGGGSPVLENNINKLLMSSIVLCVHSFINIREYRSRFESKRG